MSTWILTSDIFDQTSINNIRDNLFSLYDNIYIEKLLITLEKENPFNETIFNINFYLELFEKETPDTIIVIHPFAYRHPLLDLILKKNESKHVKFLFHIVGDFIKRGQNFLMKEDDLLGKDIHFLFCSQGYLQVCSDFFIDSSQIQKISIPLDLKSFHPSEKERLEIRNLYNIPSDQFIFLYTGRISEEKNIDKTIKLLSETSLNYKFFIIGEFDDYDGSSIGLPSKLGTIYHKIMELHSERIIILNSQPPERLRMFYNAADAFISLSCYHDEAFGFSPLESLACGTKVILTHWGGYKDFINNFGSNCLPLHLSFEDEKLKLNMENFEQKITQFLTMKTERHKLNLQILNHYSLLPIEQELQKNVLTKSIKFEGFSELFKNFIIENFLENNETKKSIHKYLKYTTQYRKWPASLYMKIYKKMWE